MFLQEIYSFVNYYEEYFGQKSKYLLFDEIQNVVGWELAVRELHETKEFYIYITGSSSKLLSKEIATSLRGRSIKYEILPLSFREYLKFLNFPVKKVYSTSEENKVKNFLLNYIKGSFPDIVLYPELANRFYEEYIDLVIFRDIVERYGVKNTHILKLLFKFLISSVSKEFSVHKTYRTLKSNGIEVSKKTLYKYISYFEDSFSVFLLKKYSQSIRKSELSIPKVYLVDTGIAHYLGLRDIGRLMENVVLLELYRRYSQKGKFRIYYYKNSSGEVDFIVVENGKIGECIQVTYELTEGNMNREIKPLLNLHSTFGCRNLRIITWDMEGNIEKDGVKINIYPLWKWLLNIRTTTNLH